MNALLITFLNHITAQTTVITPTRWFAHYLQITYQQYRARQGEIAWQTADILPAFAWITRLWESQFEKTFTCPPACLNTTQATYLWYQIASDYYQMLPPEQMIALLQTTWRTCNHWFINDEQFIDSNQPDAVVFRQLANRYQTACHQAHCLDSATLSKHLVLSDSRLPKHLLVIGFTDFPRALRPLLEGCQQQGTLVEYYPQSISRDDEVSAPVNLAEKQVYPQRISRDGVTSALASRGVYIEGHAQQMSQADNKPDLERRRVYEQPSSQPTRTTKLQLERQRVETTASLPEVTQQYHHQLSHAKKAIYPRQQIVCSESNEEVFAMARWAKSILGQAADTPTSIACVIPSLVNRQEQVMTIFNQVFQKEYDYQQPTPIGLTIPLSLNKHRITQAVFLALALLEDTMPLQKASQFLLSPFFGEAEIEYTQRAYFAGWLREQGLTHVSFREVLATEAPVSLGTVCPALANRCRRFFTLVDQLNLTTRLATYQQWGEDSLSLLAVLGWPGERALSINEQQVVEDWLACLKEYQSLDYLTTSSVNARTAFTFLAQLAKQSLVLSFPKAPALYLLSEVDEQLCYFDYLWLAGVEETTFPSLMKAYPLIPAPFKNSLPCATPEQTLIFYQQLMNKLFRGESKQIIVSYAHCSLEGLPQLPSPLIADWPVITLAQLPLASFIPVEQQVHAAKSLEMVTDQPVSLRKPDKIKNVVQALQWQALCPFKAFAYYRLQAKPFETPTIGFSRASRGQLIHDSLKYCWRAIRDQATLLAITEQELSVLVTQCLEQALEDIPNKKPIFSMWLGKSLTRTVELLTHIEKVSLRSRLVNWLLSERDRPAFTVTATEQVEKATIGPLTFTIRIDRIDSLTPTKQLIIDYKTSKQHSMSHCFDDRPEAVQLIIYALARQQAKLSTPLITTLGISFADVVPGAYRFRGISREKIEIAGIKPLTELKQADSAHWETQCHHWHRRLTRLSEDFAKGVARVDPKTTQLCQRCHLRALCRVGEVSNIL